MKIKKGDNVMVMSGKDKGKTGTVARAFPATEQVIIDGVNVQKHHNRINRRTKQGGGIVEVSAPIHVSNVQIIDPESKKPTRVGHTKNDKGKNVRIARKSGAKLK